MEYRYLGNSGLQVSALSFGAWVIFGSQADVEVVERLSTDVLERIEEIVDNRPKPEHDWR